jgi:hypothetical protein
MNPFAIGQAEAVMAMTRAAVKAKPRGPRGRAVYVTIEGKRVKTTPRGARILKNVRAAFKGLSVPD